MLIFGTLGPAGSNHEWVTKHYLAFHGLDEAKVALFGDFEQAFAAMLRGELQHIIQVAVHASVTATVARYRTRAHLIDTFISPSQAMAVLTRAEIAVPQSLGLQMATREYVDCSRWPTLVGEPTTVDVAEGLLAGKYDSGLTLSRYAEQHPDKLRVEQDIGDIVDPWLVYGMEPTCHGNVLAWPHSPAATLFRRDMGCLTQL